MYQWGAIAPSYHFSESHYPPNNFWSTPSNVFITGLEWRAHTAQIEENIFRNLLFEECKTSWKTALPLDDTKHATLVVYQGMGETSGSQIWTKQGSHNSAFHTEIQYSTKI